MYSFAIHKITSKATTLTLLLNLIHLVLLAKCHHRQQPHTSHHHVHYHTTQQISSIHHQQQNRYNNLPAQQQRAQSLLATNQPPTTTSRPVEVPEFSEPIGNHTVALGRDVQLACKIDNLGHYRTAWLRVEDKGILTIHNNVITRNYRVGLINNDDGKNFILTIKNVQASDKGGYMCQINSVPMKYAIGYLDVLTPPVFDDMQPPTTLQFSGHSDSASGGKSGGVEPLPTTTLAPSGAGLITVTEGSNATLSCRASGHPTPVITWRREDNEPILLNGASSSLDGVPKVEGASITLSSVNRLNSGAYLCIASNGVQPSASKRQLLDVQYSPVVRLPQTELTAHINQPDARLTCFVELNPLGSYHWVKLMNPTLDSKAHRSGGGGSLIELVPTTPPTDDLSLIENHELMNSDKYEIVMNQVNNEKVQMTLTIRKIERHDFGWYRCIARNSLGTQSSSIRLYESSSATASSSFPLNIMFRGQDSTAGNSQLPADLDKQQNDQQQYDSSRPSNHNNKQSILSRAHTRSSWVQRSSSGRQDPGANALLDSASGSSAARSLLSTSQLTINNFLLLLNCLIMAQAVAQTVVVTFNHHHHHRHV